jgi:inhibitor of KinA sporulation pathway (predicted exonuclease)
MSISFILYIIIGIVFFLFIKWTSHGKEIKKSKDCDEQSKVPIINLKITPNYQTISLKATKCDGCDLLNKDYYVVIDTLTVGGDYSENEIVELAYIKVSRTTGEIVDSFTSYVKPYRLEKSLHEQGDLDDAPSAKDVSERLRTVFEDAIVMGYDVKSDIGSILAMGYITNVQFDMRFFDLYDELEKDNKEPISKNVQTMAKRYGYVRKSDNQLLDNCYACETLYRVEHGDEY